LEYIPDPAGHAFWGKELPYFGGSRFMDPFIGNIDPHERRNKFYVTREWLDVGDLSDDKKKYPNEHG